MKERQIRRFPQGVCEPAGEVTELSEKKRRLRKHKLTFHRFYLSLTLPPGMGQPPPLLLLLLLTHIKTQTHTRSIPTQIKFNTPPKVQQPMTQTDNSRDLATQHLCALMKLLITMFVEMCEGSQTTMHVIEPVCGHIHPDRRPSCCNVCSAV